MSIENDNRPEGYPTGNSPLETRTTASDSHPEPSHCRRCGDLVLGRRRNGYCSDKCRMRDHRRWQAERLHNHLTTIEQAVQALREELEGHHEG
jgi:endogenous inhibitor of DNA gyrase (YacG/DUF329 family)